jgi:DNA repair exonuclease SbcCD ATPase subunit
MIKSIHIKNFLSHPDTQIELHEGLNVFVGETDSGKSAIIKALKWCTWNRPSGDSIRSWNGGDTQVEITTAEGNVITRSKDKSDRYKLNDIEFKAFGTSVPDEIAKALNLSETNLQNQLDSHYLLSLSAGEVASHWNRIARLEAIDIGTDNVNSAIRELNADIKYAHAQEKTITEDLKKYDHLDTFEKEVQALEELDKKVSILRVDAGVLETNIRRYYNNERSLLAYEKILSTEKPVSDLLELIARKKELIQKFNTLTNLRDSLEVVQQKIIIEKETLALEPLVDELLQLRRKKDDLERNYNILWNLMRNYRIDESKIKQLNRTIATETLITDLLKLYKDRETLVLQYKALSKTISSAKDIQVRLDAQKTSLVALEKKFEEALPEGSICVLCGQTIKR